MSFSAEDYHFMQRAITLAKNGHYTTSPNPRVGCVLVKNGRIIGEGFHQKAGEGHAEVNAIKDALQKSESTKGATAYVTLEPCSHFGRTPPCAKGLIEAEIANVIIAMVDPNPTVSGRGIEMLEQAGISTKTGLLETDAQALNRGFISLMTIKKPYVRCKLAASLDGKTAMASGESQWITSTDARQDVQRLRAQSCAIICGADSVITDNAKMTVRYAELGYAQQQIIEADLRQPVRIIIDSKNRVTPDLALFTQPSPIILIRQHIENTHTWPHFVEQVELPLKENFIDLSALVLFLANRSFNDVLIESGERLAGAFVSADLVDEIILYQAPKLMGADGRSLLAMPTIQALKDAKQLNFTDIRMVGQDLRITATLVKKH